MKQHWTHKYTPDPGFTERLRDYDEYLEAFWDAIKNDWVIVRRGKTGYHEIGHYKTLDNRTMQSLYDGDLWRVKSSKEFDASITNHNGKIKQEIKNRQKESAEEDARRLYVDHIREHKTQF